MFLTPPLAGLGQQINVGVLRYDEDLQRTGSQDGRNQDTPIPVVW